MAGCVVSSLLFAAASRRPTAEGPNAPSVRTLKFAHALSTTHPVHQAIVHMADRLAEISGGRLKLEIYPSETWGNETKCLEDVQDGRLDMTKTSAAPLGNFISVVKVFSLPYIFKDRDHFWRVLDGPVGREILRAMGTRDDGGASGFRGLCFFDAGSRNFYSDKPISSPADLRGLRVRVMADPVAMDMVEAMGGLPTPIPFGELYTALSTGVVDAAENNPPSILSSRHFEVSKQLSLDHHTMIPDVVIMSTAIWNELSEQERQWISQAAAEASTYQREKWQEASEDALEKLRAAGVVVHDVDLAPFRQASAPVIQQYSTGPIGDILKRIQAEQ